MVCFPPNLTNTTLSRLLLAYKTQSLVIELLSLLDITSLLHHLPFIVSEHDHALLSSPRHSKSHHRCITKLWFDGDHVSSEHRQRGIYCCRSHGRLSSSCSSSRNGIRVSHQFQHCSSYYSTTYTIIWPSASSQPAAIHIRKQTSNMQCISSNF